MVESVYTLKGINKTAMSPTLRKRRILRNVLLLFFIPFGVYSQSPGGVRGQQFWYDDTDSTALISNYHSVDLLKMGQEARDSILSIPVSSSLFFVLKGNFSTPIEDTLVQIGDVTLVDLGMYHGGGFTSISFNDSTSKIVSVQTIRGHRMARDTAPEVTIGDLSKFSVAEVIYYPYYLERAQRRMVNSYLSLKYAIPIIKGVEPDWRNYWAKDSSYYWDANKDKRFFVRVMGLGVDEEQSFYQSQSIAETGGYFKIALDTPAVPGTMPRTWMAQEGFVVFAEREASPFLSAGYCSGVRPGKNPLARWKIRATDQWRTWATKIVIDVENPGGMLADSIFLSDGSHFHYTPWVYRDADIVRYEVDLSVIVPGKNYMFTKRSSPSQSCGPVVVRADDSGISLAGGLGQASVHSFETGITFETELTSDFYLPLEEGQYHVMVTDPNGTEYFNELVGVASGGPKHPNGVFPSLKMYPNPSLAGGAVTVELSGFNGAPKHWQLVDALGRVILDQPLQESDHRVIFRAPKTVGTYTFRIVTQEGVYSLKLISAQR